MIRYTAVRLVHSLGYLLAGFAVMIGLVAWRLSSGPVTVTQLTPYLSQALDAAAGAAGNLHTSVGDTVVIWGGFAHPLELRLRDVQLTTDDGRAVLAVPELAVGLSLRALARGRLALARLALLRPTLHLERTTAGRLVLDLDGEPAVLPPLAPTAEPGATEDPAEILSAVVAMLQQPRDPMTPLGALAQLSVVEAALTVEDQVSGALWSFPQVGITASRDNDTLNAQARITWLNPGHDPVLEASVRVARGAARAGEAGAVPVAPVAPVIPVIPVINVGLTVRDGSRQAARLEGALSPADGGASLLVRLIETNPALLAPLAPLLQPLAAAALPINGSLVLALDQRFQPSHASIAFASKDGQLIAPPALLPDPVKIASTAFAAEIDQPLDPAAARVVLKTFAVDFGGPRLAIKGTIAAGASRLAVKGGITVSAVPIERLAKLWPPKVGKNARDWITSNISAGQVDNAWIMADASAPLADPSDLIATTLDAGVNASGLTVSYFKTLPPVTGIAGHGTSDGRTFTLMTSGGRISDLAVGPTRLVFSKLDTPQEWLEIDAPISGSLRATLAVLDTPPLGYARRVDLDPARTDGSQSCLLHFYFPLRKALDLDQVEIRANAMLTGASAEGIGGGLTVSEGNLKLTLDTNGMDVAGTTRLENIPTTVQWRENFNTSAEPRTRVALAGTVGEAELVRRGLNPAPYLNGATEAKVQLEIDQHHRTSLSGTLDLTPARLALPELDWKKPVGAPARARFTLGFEGGHPTVLSDLALEGEGLKATGSARFVPGSGRLERLAFSELRLGETVVKAELTTRPGTEGGYGMVLRGPRFDARPLLNSPSDPEQKRLRQQERLAKRGQPRPPGPPFDLTLVLDRVITGEDGRALTGVQGQLRHNGRGWDQAELAADVAGSKAGFALRYLPDGGLRRLNLTSNDFGAVLKALDLTDSLVGGRLKLTGLGPAGVPAQPFGFHLALDNYRLVKAPLLARVLNAASVTGLMELLQGEGVSFDQAVGDLTWSEDKLAIATLRTAGSALGLTVGGEVDLAADTLAIQGTIVPVYGLNRGLDRLIGMVPLVGDWLSGGEGQGVFAATFSLNGPADQPKIGVNPLAVLAPGALRNLFFLP